MSKMAKEGPYAVIRDEDGRVVHKHLDKKGPRKNWKHWARLVTNNGMNQFEKMVAISEGRAFQTEITLPTGEKVLSEPMIPPLAIQHQAALDVFELLHGKAVAATEVVKAEEEAKELERVRAMSDAELYRLLERGTEDAELVEDTDEEMTMGKWAQMSPGEFFELDVESHPYDPSEGDE